MALGQKFDDVRVPAAVQRWLQAAWLALVGPLTAFYLVGLVIFLRTPMTLCSVETATCTEAAAAAELARFGLMPGVAVALSGSLIHIGVPVGCLLMAAFIFGRRPDRPITLAVSAMLALYGPFKNTGLVDVGLDSLGLAGLGTVYALLFGTLTSYTLLTFPNGRFVPAWSWLLLVVGLAVDAAAAASGAASDDEPPTLVLFLIVAFALQAYRYKRVSSAAERQQSKWGLVGLAAFLLNAVLWVGVVEPANTAGVTGLPYLVLFAPLNFVLVLGFPAALMIASLRYHLWDIDVLVRRTLVYSALTAVLALIYFGSVIVLQGILQALTGQRQSALVTVLSTLAIAALFGPLRSRVQAAIDRRFYRRKYNAARIMAAFSATLRTDAYAELDNVTAQLIETVNATLQPAEAGLWLKPPTKDQRG
jgi:hypothetical protein